jgi:hypothetical protein
MRKLSAIIVVLLCFGSSASFAQNSIVQEGEFGFGIGAAHYFGDLNTRARLNRPKFAASLFFRKNFGNYIALRVSGTFAQLGYSDIYNKQNPVMLQRNLSFNTNIWELAVQGDFNFFRYIPGDETFNYTPYITFGLGVFNYDPYAYLNGKKYFLRPLGTEGQGSPLFPDRKPYGSMAVCIPIGVGFKYALNERMSIGFEVVHRFTTTDYIDDVSTTYPGSGAFTPIPPATDNSTNPAFLLSDRSYELGTPIGIKGRQRGNSKQKDQYATALIYLTFNLQSYRCPTAY